MAKPIAFKPITVDFKADLVRKLEKAPAEHAEALLLAYDVLEEAHKKGLLDLLHGVVSFGIHCLRNLDLQNQVRATLQIQTHMNPVG